MATRYLPSCPPTRLPPRTTLTLETALMEAWTLSLPGLMSSYSTVSWRITLAAVSIFLVSVRSYV